MDITGSDANKLYEDVLVTGYDSNKKPIKDPTKPSFSTTFFKAQEGNKEFADASSWMLQPLSPLNVNILPGVASPLLSAASFNG